MPPRFAPPRLVAATPSPDIPSYSAAPASICADLPPYHRPECGVRDHHMGRFDLGPSGPVGNMLHSLVRERKRGMADRARRPILRAGDNQDRRPTLGLVAPSGEILPVASAAPRLAAPERAPILLSPARDLIGITPRAWLAVAALYCALAGVALYLDWRAVPP